MHLKRLLLALCCTVCLLLAVGWLLVFLQSARLVPRELNPARTENAGAEQAQPGQSAPPAPAGQAVFNPPALEAAPKEIREAVLLGYKIMMDTPHYAGDYIGNDLSCRNCHFDGGRNKDTISLVGVAASYPHYRSRRGYAADLTLRTQGCFERSMNGTAPPADSQVMQSLKAYYFWISKGIPIYADIPWLRLPGVVLKDYTPDPAAGQEVYTSICSRCHGQDGRGTAIAPPLWGPKSFNDGAGMHKIKHFSAFSYRFMPKNSPSLSKKQAMDIAGYAQTQERPHFISTHENTIKRVISLPKEGE